MSLKLNLFHQSDLVRDIKYYFTNPNIAKDIGSLQSSTYELQSYLTTTFEFVNSPDFDILQWWKEHQRRFHFCNLDIDSCAGATI